MGLGIIFSLTNIQAIMAITLDNKAYGSLLATYQPKIIASEDEYNRTLESIEQMMVRGEELTPEENSLLELLFGLWTKKTRFA